MPNQPTHQDHTSSSDYRYLEQLQFNPELRKSWLNFFVTNFRVVVLLILLLSAWGLYSYQQLPLESNPEVKIPVAMVATPYPGASPADVEELVTKKIETKIASLKGVKEISSTSANSLSSISVEFEAGEDLENSIRNLKDKVAETESELPDEAEKPVVREISLDDQPILTLAITGPYDGLTLREYADIIQDELEKIPGVREVRVSGGDEKEISVAYDPNKLALYGISAETANRVIAATNLALPSGNVDGENFTYPVRTDARLWSAEEVGALPILYQTNGDAVYLRDIAEVKETVIERHILSRLSIAGTQPQEAVTINIVKKTGGSIIDVVDASKATVDRLLATFPKEITYDTTTDFSEFIRRDFDQLKHDFVLTLILVMGTLFLVVGLKEALVAGLAIPLVFFVTFGIMLMTGVSLNFLSLFSLLLALGLLVDDAIVVVSATKQYLRTGKFTPEEAVLLVLNDFKVVLTTTTLATVWAFLPLLLASGIMGQYLRSIPITVSVVLVSSLIIALIVNHPLAAVLERIRLTKGNFLLLVGAEAILAFMVLTQSSGLLASGAGFALLVLFFLSLRWYFFRNGRQVLRNNRELVAREWADNELIKQKLKHQGSKEHTSFLNRLLHGIVHLDHVIPRYEKYLRALIATRKRRISALWLTIAVFIGATMLPISGIVPMEFFPASDEETIYINISAPAGLKLEETDAITRRMEERLLQYPEVINFSTIVGQPGASANQASGPGGTPSHLASIVVGLSKPEERSITSYDLSTRMRQDFASIQEATVSVESLQGGPPTGAAFEARIAGDDLETLDALVQELKGVLATIPGAVDIDSSLEDAPADYTFMLNPARMEYYGLNAASVGSTLRMALSGIEVSTIIRNNTETNIVARFDNQKVPDLASIQNLQVLNLRQEPIPLKEVADVKLIPSVNAITRIDQKRTVRLTAGAEGTTRPNEIVSAFQKKVAEEHPLPTGYTITYGGENEENQESVLSILRALVVALILIVTTLVIQFNSFRKAIIVLVALPLALIGVFLGLALFGIPLSFPGLIGILALFGIVVKNAIILIDKINLNLKSEIPFEEAVIDAGKSRLEAILITSLCTILGILPVTLSNDFWRALGSAIIFGLTLSSFLTLFIVPLLFVTFARPRQNIVSSR
jgi:multidrug efflux pump subunit AcrB